MFEQVIHIRTPTLIILLIIHLYCIYSRFDPLFPFPKTILQECHPLVQNRKMDLFNPSVERVLFLFLKFCFSLHKV